MRLNYGKTFLLGFGFFGVSVIWGVYNAFVPLMLANKFGLAPVWIGFFMTLDNIAALLIQPPVGAWSDRLRTPIGRRMPFILVGAPLAAIAFGLIPLAAVLPLFVACTSTLLLSMALWRTPVIALMPDITPSQLPIPGQRDHQFHGWSWRDRQLLARSSSLRGQHRLPVLAWFNSGHPRQPARPCLYQGTQELRDGRRKTQHDCQHEGSRLRPGPQCAAHVDGDLLLVCGLQRRRSVFYALCPEAPRTAGSRWGAFARTAFLRLRPDVAPLRLYRRTVRPPENDHAWIGLHDGGADRDRFPFGRQTLVQPLTKLPVLGVVPVIGLLLMVAGLAWALININSLPMVVDMTDAVHLGTFTGLYYLSSTLAAIVGPNVNGWIIQLSGSNYSATMIAAPFFMLVAFLMMLGVHRGEAVSISAA